MWKLLLSEVADFVLFGLVTLGLLALIVLFLVVIGAMR